mmetsp:Transcript_46685/g.116327  ORF Transcript_46685/g.116327 Transcript_46685/m.116327 type:complete len:904 (-) Transcript_46685:785-3496(-)
MGGQEHRSDTSSPVYHMAHTSSPKSSASRPSTHSPLPPSRRPASIAWLKWGGLVASCAVISLFLTSQLLSFRSCGDPCDEDTEAEEAPDWWSRLGQGEWGGTWGWNPWGPRRAFPWKGYPPVEEPPPAEFAAAVSGAEGAPVTTFPTEFDEKKPWRFALWNLGATEMDDLVERQKASILAIYEQVLGPYRNGYAALVGLADHENKGDSAINYGEYLILQHFNITSVYHCSTGGLGPCDMDQMESAVRSAPKNLVILCHGGGNFGDIWRQDPELRERVVARFLDYEIVVFPQSIAFTDDRQRLAHARRMRHRRITYLVRDHASYKFLVDPDNGFQFKKAILCPDSAFMIGSKRPGWPKDIDILWVHRGDPERTDIAIPKAPEGVVMVSEDWLNYKKLSKANTVSWQKFQLNFFMDKFSHMRVDRAFSFLARAKIVVTERLHGHILSTMLDTPHVVLDNNYGKIRHYRETWTAGLRDVLVANSTDSALQSALVLLNRYQQDEKSPKGGRNSSPSDFIVKTGNQMTTKRMTVPGKGKPTPKRPRPSRQSPAGPQGDGESLRETAESHIRREEEAKAKRTAAAVEKRKADAKFREWHPLHICMAVDGDGIEQLPTVLNSIHKSNADDFAAVHVLYRDVDSAKRGMVNALIDRFEANGRRHMVLEWVRVPDHFAHFDSYKQPHDMPHLSKSQATMWRLFTPTMLPFQDRLIFLDLDVIVDGRLRPLWDLPPQQHCGIWARSSKTPKVINDWLNDTGSFPALNYTASRSFNAGVLVMDLSWLRGNHFEPFAKRYINEYGVNDQIILNFYCDGKYGELPPQYNAFVGSSSKRDTALGSKAPIVLHFAGRRKPWNNQDGKQLEFQSKWDEYQLELRPLSDDERSQPLAPMPPGLAIAVPQTQGNSKPEVWV